TDYSSYSENTYDQYQDPNTYYQQTEDTSQYYTPSQDTQSYDPYAGQEQNGYGYDQNNEYGTTSGY
ncbi:LytR family transcriptional regulator, partial [Enterococcus faecium]|nr:LytR family transcriptional regulator [Enterococcus faecium]